MKKSDGTSMRRASSIVYAVFALFALFLINGYTQYGGITSISNGIIIEYILIFIFLTISIKLFGGTGEVSSSTCRELVIMTGFYIIFNIFTFTVQTDSIAKSWQVLVNNSTSEYTVLSIVLLVIKLLLPVIALFLASMSVSEQKNEGVDYVVTDTVIEDEDEDEELEIVEIDEEVETKEQEQAKKEQEREKKKKVRY